VSCVDTIRDKDSTPACIYLAALHLRLQRGGKTLLDYYLQILEDLGGYYNHNRSIMMVGSQGMRRKDRIMEILRTSPPRSLAGQQVNEVVDYWDQDRFGPFVSETDKLPRNVIQIFTDTIICTVRPSGTEPKLKFYCQLLPGGEASGVRGMDLLAELRGKTEDFTRRTYNDLLGYIELSLGDAALRLPDIVDLDRKLDFEQQTLPGLKAALGAETYKSLADLLAWLRQETAAMTPGADPLPAVKETVRYLCGQWAAELSSSSLLLELRDWACQ